jgi:hypothetical protein
MIVYGGWILTWQDLENWLATVQIDKESPKDHEHGRPNDHIFYPFKEWFERQCAKPGFPPVRYIRLDSEHTKGTDSAILLARVSVNVASQMSLPYKEQYFEDKVRVFEASGLDHEKFEWTNIRLL